MCATVAIDHHCCQVVAALLLDMQQYDPHLFTPDSDVVKSWLAVGAKAEALLDKLAVPHTLDNNGWALNTFRQLREDAKAPAD